MFALMPINIRLALRSLDRNRMRTLLTMLGRIIGVAAVLTMVALGTGARASVEGEVSSAGTSSSLSSPAITRAAARVWGSRRDRRCRYLDDRRHGGVCATA